MHEIDDQDELNDDEQKTADESEVHENLLERAVAWYVEGAHDQTDEYEHFEEPEAVLYVGARITR